MTVKGSNRKKKRLVQHAFGKRKKAVIFMLEGKSDDRKARLGPEALSVERKLP